MNLGLNQIAKIISAQGAVNSEAIALGYSIDSRTIQPGELFFAVIGERLDGHVYVEQALSKGAIAAVIMKKEVNRFKAEGNPSAPTQAAQSKLLLVDDTLAALQSLATGVRKLWGKKLVGVTGSAGKTTTKEAIAHVVAAKFRVLKSEGNFNNQFGLPLMLLKLQPEHDIAVIEMGMSHAGEIAALARIAQPQIGVVTNVAAVHLEFFDSIEGIAAAKRELIESLPPGGIAILNADDERVAKFAERFRGKVITYGINPTANVFAENIQSQGAAGTTFDVLYEGHREKVRLPLLGAHNVLNALAAVAVAGQCRFNLSESVQALSTVTAPSKRGEVIQVGNITVINDCYNSNPKALQAMVEALSTMSAKRRIVVAGEMLELGATAEEAHRESGRYLAKKKIDVLIGVRGLAKPMVEAAREAGMQAEFVTTPEEAGAWLGNETREGDVVLLKASRGVQLERALETWQNRIAKN